MACRERASLLLLPLKLDRCGFCLVCYSQLENPSRQVFRHHTADPSSCITISFLQLSQIAANKASRSPLKCQLRVKSRAGTRERSLACLQVSHSLIVSNWQPPPVERHRSSPCSRSRAWWTNPSEAVLQVVVHRVASKDRTHAAFHCMKHASNATCGQTDSMQQHTSAALA